MQKYMFFMVFYLSGDAEIIFIWDRSLEGNLIFRLDKGRYAQQQVVAKFSTLDNFYKFAPRPWFGMSSIPSQFTKLRQVQR